MKQNNLKSNYQPCGIYKITNKINNHAYIGQSIHIYQRWEEHIRLIDSDCTYTLYNAFRKYGLINFDFLILEECKQEQLNEREIYWIAYYDTFYNGYNETKGGQTQSDLIKIPVEQYDKQGNFIASYLSITEASKITGAKNISGVCKGKKYTSGGYQWFYKGQANPIDLTNCNLHGERAVLQYDLDGNYIKEFKSITEAARSINMVPSAIGRNCQHINQRAGNYQWKYKDDLTPIEKVEIIKHHYREVAQYDLDGNFITCYTSISEAERQLGIPVKSSNITRVCKGQAYQSNNYQWRYIEDGIDYTWNIGKCPQIALYKNIKIAQCNKESHKIIQIFNSIHEASRVTGINRANITRTCGGYTKSAGGYYWKKI